MQTLNRRANSRSIPWFPLNQPSNVPDLIFLLFSSLPPMRVSTAVSTFWNEHIRWIERGLIFENRWMVCRIKERICLTPPPPRHDTNRLSTNRTIMEFGSRTSVSPVISSHPFPSHPGQKPVCRTWPVPPRRGLVSPPPHHSLPSVTRLWPLTLKLKAQPAHTQCEQSDSLYHGSFHWLFTTSWFIHLLVPSVGRQRVRQSRW